MEEQLDLLTDALIEKVGKALKDNLNKIIENPNVEKEIVVEEIANIIGVSVEDIEAVLDEDIALIDLATICRITLAIGLNFNVIPTSKTDTETKDSSTLNGPQEHRKECHHFNKFRNTPHYNFKPFTDMETLIFPRTIERLLF